MCRKLLFPMSLILLLTLVSQCSASLVAHWKLDEAGGTTAYDSVDGFHGTLANMDPLTDWVRGRIDGGLHFDGIDDYVVLPDLNLNSNSMTITLWLRSDANQNGYAGLVFRRTANENASGFNFSSITNELGYHWNNQEWDWHSGPVVPNGRWVFAAISIASTQATIYLGDLNTGPLVSATDSHAVYTEQFNLGAIGADVYSEGGRYFNGVLDEVTVWNYSLSEAEIFYIAKGGEGRVYIPPESPANLYEDDAIDFKDFAEFALYWLETCL